MNSSDEDAPEQAAPVEVLYFRVAAVSLPLNFCVLLNPIMIQALHLPDTGSALLRGPKGAIVPVKALPDPECPQKDILVPYSVQLSLRAAIGDTVPMMAFTKEESCTAIQIQPLFEGIDEEIQADVAKYFESDSRPVAPGTFFGVGPRMFKVLNCLPSERCFASSATKIYYKEAPGCVAEEALPVHFSDLILPSAVKEVVRNGVWLPMNNRAVFETLNMPTGAGVLVTGSDGNGKTSFLSAVWSLLNVPSLFVDAARIGDDVDKKLKEIFGKFPEGKEKCAIFIDNIQHIAKKFTSLKFSNERRRMARFFSLLDKAMANPGIAIIASAISVTQIDESLIRPGRFGFVIDLEKPNVAQRADIIRMNTRGLSIQPEDVDALAKRVTNNMTRGEIQDMCRKGVNRMVNPESSGVAHPTDGLVVFSKNMQLRMDHFTVGLKIDYNFEETPEEPVNEAPIVQEEIQRFEEAPNMRPADTFAEQADVFGDRNAARNFPRRKNETGFDLSGVAPSGMKRPTYDEAAVFQPRVNKR